MQTATDEIASGIFRFSTFVADVPPSGLTFNQFLVRGEDPFLFHCGPRAMFPLVWDAVRRVIDLRTLRWISFGHIESDECGAMNEWLAAATDAQIVHGEIGCSVSLNDLADRAPRALADDDVLDLGGKRVRFLYTPHVPHYWESGVFLEETTRTLLCGDLFTQIGPCPAVSESDPVAPTVAAEAVFHGMSLSPNTRATLERLAALEPTMLALMHGPSFRGDGARALRDLAGALCG